MTAQVTDVTCEHGTLLAAWCGQCASEWVPDGEIPSQSNRSQSAA